MLILSLFLAIVPFSSAEADQKSYEVGSIVEFGQYEQDADLSNGPEKIQWLILDIQENRALLLSLSGLACRQYHDKMESVRWGTCTLRTWLNDEFYSGAFSEAERDAILQPEIDNSPEQAGQYLSYIKAKNTRDNVFLLSGAEIETIPAKAGVMKKYEIQDILKDLSPTQYALNNGSENMKVSRESYYWWLRGVTEVNINASTNKTNAKAQCVNKGGANNAADIIASLGVHPAIWVDLAIMEKAQKDEF